MLAVVRDAKGAVREHFSQDSPVEVPEKNLEALKRGNAVFTRSFTVPPGRYGLELVVLDQTAKQASVRRSVLVVAPPPAALALSSVAVVKRTEPVTEGALESTDPLRNGRHRIVPFVGEPTFPAGETVSLFLVAYPAAGPGATGLTLEFSRDGAVVGRSTAELPAARRTRPHPLRGERPDAEPRPGALRGGRGRAAGRAAARERAFFTVARRRRTERAGRGRPCR